jgi:hypothetical protein
LDIRGVGTRGFRVGNWDWKNKIVVPALGSIIFKGPFSQLDVKGSGSVEIESRDFAIIIIYGSSIEANGSLLSRQIIGDDVSHLGGIDPRNFEADILIIVDCLGSPALCAILRAGSGALK